MTETAKKLSAQARKLSASERLELAYQRGEIKAIPLDNAQARGGRAV